MAFNKIGLLMHVRNVFNSKNKGFSVHFPESGWSNNWKIWFKRISRQEKLVTLHISCFHFIIFYIFNIFSFDFRCWLWKVHIQLHCKRFTRTFYQCVCMGKRGIHPRTEQSLSDWRLWWDLAVVIINFRCHILVLRKLATNNRWNTN